MDKESTVGPAALFDNMADDIFRYADIEVAITITFEIIVSTEPADSRRGQVAREKRRCPPHPAMHDVGAKAAGGEPDFLARPSNPVAQAKIQRFKRDTDILQRRDHMRMLAADNVLLHTARVQRRDNIKKIGLCPAAGAAGDEVHDLHDLSLIRPPERNLKRMAAGGWDACSDWLQINRLS